MFALYRHSPTGCFKKIKNVYINGYSLFIGRHIMIYKKRTYLTKNMVSFWLSFLLRLGVLSS